MEIQKARLWHPQRRLPCPIWSVTSFFPIVYRQLCTKEIAWLLIFTNGLVGQCIEKKKKTPIKFYSSEICSNSLVVQYYPRFWDKIKKQDPLLIFLCEILSCVLNLNIDRFHFHPIFPLGVYVLGYGTCLLSDEWEMATSTNRRKLLPGWDELTGQSW